MLSKNNFVFEFIKLQQNRDTVRFELNKHCSIKRVYINLLCLQRLCSVGEFAKGCKCKF